MKVTITLEIEADRLSSLKDFLLGPLDFSDISKGFSIYSDSLYIDTPSKPPLSLLKLLEIHTSGNELEHIRNQIAKQENDK